MSGAPPLAYPFWYLDHGSDTLVRSEHDNSQVVRWCLREKGVVLAGPDPATLVDPVSPAALKAEVRRTMDLCLAVGHVLVERSVELHGVFALGLCTQCDVIHHLVAVAQLRFQC